MRILAALMLVLAQAASAIGQTTESSPRLSDAIVRAIEATRLDIKQQPSGCETVLRLQKRGHNEKVVGYHLLAIGALLMPSGLDFVIPGKYRLDNFSLPFLAAGAIVAGLGHKNGNLSESKGANTCAALRVATMF